MTEAQAEYRKEHLRNSPYWYRSNHSAGGKKPVDLLRMRTDDGFEFTVSKNFGVMGGGSAYSAVQSYIRSHKICFDTLLLRADPILYKSTVKNFVVRSNSNSLSKPGSPKTYKLSEVIAIQKKVSEMGLDITNEETIEYVAEGINKGILK